MSVIVRVCAIVSSFVVAIGLALWAYGETNTEVVINPKASEITFSEDFDRLDVSASGPGSRWKSRLPWNGNFGDAKFVDPAQGFPFTVKDGILTIEARKPVKGKWQSGLLASTDAKGNGFTQLYGYFEMRARFPAGPGVWPAFWLTSRGDVKAIEVDIVEHYGQFPGTYTTAMHIWDRKKPALSKNAHERVQVDPGTLSSDLHTYGAAIDATRIRYFFDRREVWSVPTPAELEHPFTILIDLGLGGGWPIDKTPNPSTMEVDYVRVWKSPNG